MDADKPRAVQNGMSPEEHATWMFLADKKALDEPYTYAIKQSDLTGFIQQEIAKAKRQTAYDIITQFKADRINHTLGTSVAEWEREFETADKTLEQYIKGLTLKEHKEE